MPLPDLMLVVAVLVHNGFGVEEDELGRAALGHAEHGGIDLHPVIFDPQGNGV